MPMFYAFFDKEEIRKHGIDLAKVAGPHQARCTEGHVYSVLCSQALHDPKYDRLDKDPKYVKKVVSGN